MLYFSTSCISSRNINESLRKLINAGVRNIELSNSEEVIPEVETWLFNLKQKYQLNFLIHNYFPPSLNILVLNLASQDSIIIKRTIKHCKRSIELAKLLDISIYSVHAGFCMDPKPSELGRPLNQTQIAPYGAGYSTMVESLKELCEFAGKLDIDVAVENHEINQVNLTNGKNKLLLMCEANEFMRLFTDVKKDNLKILIDLGHLNVAATTLRFDKFEFIKKVRHKTILFHLSANNGLTDEHKLITENSWFWPILKECPQIDCVVESHDLTYELICQIRRIYQQRFYE